MFKWKARRGIKGKPWAKLTGQDFADRTFLNKVGEVLVKAVVREAKKEALGESTTRARIPNYPKFYDSFKYRIVGESTVEVYSTWEWIDAILEKKDPYSSNKSSRKRAPFSDPMGKIVFKSTPGTGRVPWIPVGFGGYSFMQRGLAVANIKIKEMYRQRVVQVLKMNSPV